MASRIDAIRIFAPAKINLYLHVGQRRGDGFHELESLVTFTELGDDLIVRRSDQLSMKISGPFASFLPASNDNLVIKAANLLAQRAQVPAVAEITLEKNLPVASGIGGGSADAAAALRGLRALWALYRPDDGMYSERHRDLAKHEAMINQVLLELGSDVPVCFHSNTTVVEGRGERSISYGCPIPIVDMVLVNPNVGVSTAEVFSRKEPKDRVRTTDFPRSIGDGQALAAFLETTSNELETPAREIAPVIGDVLQALKASGALFARMSGSGATCFGIFQAAEAAQSGATAISKARPDWWARATKIATSGIGRPRPAV